MLLQTFGLQQSTQLAIGYIACMHECNFDSLGHLTLSMNASILIQGSSGRVGSLIVHVPRMHSQAVDDSLIVVVLAGHGIQREVLDTSRL